MHGSQIRNSFTLIQKPLRIASKDSRAWWPLKNSSWTLGHPGEARTPTSRTPKTTTVTTVAIRVR